MKSAAGTSPASGQWPSALADLFRQQQTPAERAAALAALLRDFYPQARLTACRLGAVANPVLAILPEEHGTDAAGTLRDLTVVQVEMRRLSFGGMLANLQSLLAPIPGETGARGLLVVGLPPKSAKAAVGRIEESLTLTAALVGLHLRAEADAHRLRDLRTEVEARDEVATIGDAMMGLTHDLSNNLNTMMLQASIVQLKVDAALQEDLLTIRRAGATAAGLIRLLQNYRETARRSFSTLDLNQLLRDAAATIPELDVRARWQLESTPLSVRANRDGLWRLLVRLLRRAAGTTPTREPFLFQSGRKDGVIYLSLGPFLERDRAECLADLFADPEDGFSRGGALEGIAAESLARLVEAHCRVEPHVGGGFVAILEWTMDDAPEGRRR